MGGRLANANGNEYMYRVPTERVMDPGDYVYTPRRTRRVVLHGVPDTRNSQVWDAVLDQFIAMGATRTNTKADAWRIQHDTAFYHEWASSLPNWCPSLASYETERP